MEYFKKEILVIIEIDIISLLYYCIHILTLMEFKILSNKIFQIYDSFIFQAPAQFSFQANQKKDVNY